MSVIKVRSNVETGALRRSPSCRLP